MQKLILGLILLGIIGCSDSSKKQASHKSDSNNNALQYLFLAHTRMEANPKVITSIYNIDFSKYEMLWLGGDMAQLSSESTEVLEHLNGTFELKNPNTLWALGNHDYSDTALVQKFTDKPRFYSTYKNGITLMVWDTQDSLCHITGSQLDLFNEVVDTLNKSSHLIILHHKLIWLYGNDVLENRTDNISNAPIDTCSYCIQPNNFYQDIYPKLVSLNQKDIQVICVGGDIGFKTQTFEHTTPDGIHFLASGMSFNEKVNYGLVFHHDTVEQKLNWTFEALGNL